MKEYLPILIFLVFRRDVQFDRIEADDFERRLTLFAMNNLSLIHVFIDVDLRMAFRTSC